MTPLRLMGLRVGKISDDSFCQMSLFEEPHARKKKEFEKTVDSIRNRFGIDSIKRASFLTKRCHRRPCCKTKRKPLKQDLQKTDLERNFKYT